MTKQEYFELIDALEATSVSLMNLSGRFSLCDTEFEERVNEMLDEVDGMLSLYERLSLKDFED